ncbi:MAG: zinc-ribbon domain-containing protein [Eubacteriales bacterium]
MAFCSKCGTEIGDGAKFCPGCGAAVNAPVQAQPAPDSEPRPQAAPTEDADIASNKGMAVLGYIGPLCFIPLLAKKDSPFAQFHAKQGLGLFAIDVAYSILSFLLNLIKVDKIYTDQFFGMNLIARVTPWPITALLSIIGVAIFVYAVIGIVNAATGKKNPLPFIGEYIGNIVDKIFK